MYFSLQEDGGVTKIEVQDNGCGIPSEYISVLCKPHYTSKIKTETDLLNLCTYGFRGEALSSLCAVSDVSVITKTKEDFASTHYHFDSNGNVTNKKTTHHNNGTILIVCNIFKNLPVRKQRFTKKKIKNEIKKIEELLISYALIKPILRLSLKHGSNLIWQKHRSQSIHNTVSNLFGMRVLEYLEEVNIKLNGDYEVHGFVPSLKADIDVIGRPINDRIFIFVNDRPVIIKEVKIVS